MMEFNVFCEIPTAAGYIDLRMFDENIMTIIEKIVDDSLQKNLTTGSK